MPVAQSPSYHGYDTTDYRTVEHDYGTNDDFAAFLDAAHERGIARDRRPGAQPHLRPSIPGSSSPLGPAAPSARLVRLEPDDPHAGARGTRPVWHPEATRYYFGVFWEGMPDLNLRNPEVTAELYDVARFWLQDMGVDGFRLDAVSHLIEDGNDYETTRAHPRVARRRGTTTSTPWTRTRSPSGRSGRDTRTSGLRDRRRGRHRLRVPPRDGILMSILYQAPGPFARSLGTALALYPSGQFAPFLTQPRPAPGDVHAGR